MLGGLVGFGALTLAAMSLGRGAGSTGDRFATPA